MDELNRILTCQPSTEETDLEHMDIHQRNMVTVLLSQSTAHRAHYDPYK